PGAGQAPGRGHAARPAPAGFARRNRPPTGEAGRDEPLRLLRPAGRVFRPDVRRLRRPFRPRRRRLVTTPSVRFPTRPGFGWSGRKPNRREEEDRWPTPTRCWGSPPTATTRRFAAAIGTWC